MNPMFQAVWKKTVATDLARLARLWNKHGGEWLSHLSGETLTELAYKYCPCRLPNDWRRFDELSGEEQYAFACWVKEKEEA